MRSKYILIALVLVALGFGVGRLSAAVGTVDSPDVPGNTQSFTLNDIYNRLDGGAAGAQSTFTEPAAGPGTGTMHDLNDVMDEAPAIDNTNGATETNVLDGKAFWGLTGGQWGTQIGTMPNNVAVTIVPTTTQQTIALGYHDGAGKVEGDADLVAGSIARGVDLFGVSGICRAVRATGQTGCWDQSGVSIPCAGTGQDGEYELGCRPGAYPVSNSKGFNRGFTDNGDGTVTDNLTGLIWLKDADCIGTWTWSNALTQVSNLNSGTDFSCDSYTAGTFSDWRLPHVNELSSLVDPVQTNPALPASHPFTGVHSYPYWSSTTPSYTPHAGRVNLSSGHVVNGDKTSSFYVWPVRGGQ